MQDWRLENCYIISRKLLYKKKKELSITKSFRLFILVMRGNHRIVFAFLSLLFSFPHRLVYL